MKALITARDTSWEKRTPTARSVDVSLAGDLVLSMRFATVRGARAVAVLLIIPIVAAGLLVPTWIASWSPVIHIECTRGPEILEEQLWTPIVTANSPHGGRVFDNGTVPSYIPGLPGYPYSTSRASAPASDGAAAGAFFVANVSISATQNRTVLGPGTNAPCSSARQIDYLAPVGVGDGGVTFSPIPVPSNLSDAGEAPNATLGADSFYFNNGFTSQNAPPISTCGGPSRSVHVSAPDFTVWTPASNASSHSAIPVVLPFAVNFHYTFPADFGTWGVDNLSSPGGPGGGWAFSYSPCVP
jgi:hypothetical protein